MTRIDTHRPSVIEPADYSFVGFQYLRVDDLGSALFLADERRRIQTHMGSTGGDYSKHEHGGNCAICGSVNAIYKALFWHKPSNSYISTGLDCAEKLDCSGIEAFRRNVANAREQKAGKRKAEAVLTDAGLTTAWLVYESQAEGREESTVRDIVGKLVQYGSLSPAQLAFVRRLLDQIANRAEIQAKRAVEMESAAPVPVTDKRITIRGKVLSVKVPDYDRGDFGPVRMLVQHANGWKVWGSVPSNLAGIVRGAEIEFDATVKVSDKDTKFGFFSRPTKARQLDTTP